MRKGLNTALRHPRGRTPSRDGDQRQRRRRVEVGIAPVALSTRVNTVGRNQFTFKGTLHTP